MSILHMGMTQVIEILPQVRQEHKSISCVFMSCRRKKPGHYQSWYLLYWTELIRFLHAKGWYEATIIWTLFAKRLRHWEIYKALVLP